MDYETILDGMFPEDHQRPQHHNQMPIDPTTSACAPTHHDLMQTTEPRIADILQGFMDDPSIDPLLALPGALQDRSNALLPLQASTEDSLYALLPSHAPMDGSTEAILGSASPMQDSSDVLLSSQFPFQESPIPMLPLQPHMEDTLDAFLPHMATEGSNDFDYTDMWSMSAAELFGDAPLLATHLRPNAQNAAWVSPSLMQSPEGATDSLHASTAVLSSGLDFFETQPQANRQHKRMATAALGPKKPMKKAEGNKPAGAIRRGSARAPRQSKSARSTEDASASSPPRKVPLEADMMDYIQSGKIVGPTSAAQGFFGVPLHRVSCCMLKYLDVHAGFNCPAICTARSLLGI